MKSYEDHEEGANQREVVKEKLDQLVDFVLANEVGERLKEDDFSDQFSPEDIEQDKKTVQTIKARLEEKTDYLDPETREEQARMKKRSDALEIVIADQGELNGWFGLNAFLVRTSEYDDYVNGADIIVEFDLGEEKESEKFAIAVDASFGTLEDFIERKIRRNIRRMLGIKDREGKLAEPAEVKYFRSEIDGHTERLQKVVPVVVGLDRRHTNQIMGLFSDLLKLRKQEAFYGKNRRDENMAKSIKEKIRDKNMRLAQHSVQIVLLEEITKQLEMYLRLLDEAASDRQEKYMSQTRTLLSIFRDILEEKKEISREAVEDDRVFAKVKEVTEGQRTSRSFNPK